MSRGFSSTLVFALFTGIFSTLYFVFLRDPALLAGAVFAGLIGFRFQEPIGMRRWFPIGMLLLFLLVLGTLPFRGPRVTVMHTTLLLLSMRGLLLSLAKIREPGVGVDRSSVALSAGLAIQFFVSLSRLVYSFKSATPEPAALGFLDLRALALIGGSS
ncbi:MAG: hypothetical protein EBX52_00265 [Proteobacteria bacterium]|nr:hypothetical protein [Pseudomonadota bacterium]